MTLPQNPIQAWLALYMIPGLGNVVLKRLFERFLQIEAIFEAGFFDLMGVEGLRKEIAKKILDRKYLEQAEEAFEKAQRCNARILTYGDPAYPVLLRRFTIHPWYCLSRERKFLWSKPLWGWWVPGIRPTTV